MFVDSTSPLILRNPAQNAHDAHSWAGLSLHRWPPAAGFLIDLYAFGNPDIVNFRTGVLRVVLSSASSTTVVFRLGISSSSGSSLLDVSAVGPINWYYGWHLLHYLSITTVCWLDASIPSFDDAFRICTFSPSPVRHFFRILVHLLLPRVFQEECSPWSAQSLHKRCRKRKTYGKCGGSCD